MTRVNDYLYYCCGKQTNKQIAWIHTHLKDDEFNPGSLCIGTSDVRPLIVSVFSFFSHFILDKDVTILAQVAIVNGISSAGNKGKPEALSPARFSHFPAT